VVGLVPLALVLTFILRVPRSTAVVVVVQPEAKRMLQVLVVVQFLVVLAAVLVPPRLALVH